MDPEPLSIDGVVEYLATRDRVDLAPPVTTTLLSGGVSGRCLLVETGSARVVVKQALPRLAVDEEWLADPARAITEARALVLLGRFTPGRVPEVLDVDPDRSAFTMTAADPGQRPWRDVLLEDPLDTDEQTAIAEGLGDALGRWHRGAWGDAGVAAEFPRGVAFEQLRVTPFHRTVAERHPEVAEPITRCIDELLTRTDTLVHGDFSPKNVLVGRAPSWIIDAEVAHVGAAVFDPAFFLSHLVLKTVHRAQYARVYTAAADAFLAGYRAQQPDQAGHELLAWHIACLLLSRVDGLSPAGYLTPADRERVRDLALAVLRTPRPDLDLLWDAALGATA